MGKVLLTIEIEEGILEGVLEGILLIQASILILKRLKDVPN